MPLELGMAIYRTQLDEKHDWLALVPDAAYDLYVSDLGGFDPEVYDGTCEQLIYKVVSFLSVQDEATPRVGPRLVLDAVSAFNEEKRRAERDWAGNPPPWPILVEAASRALLR
jgi:hypothetical protein